MDKKVIIFSAPSGAGKSTIVRHLLTKFNCLEFSVSATSRAPRGQEVDGKDYYFFSTEEFEDKIRKGDFVEYEVILNKLPENAEYYIDIHGLGKDFIYTETDIPIDSIRDTEDKTY